MNSSSSRARLRLVVSTGIAYGLCGLLALAPMPTQDEAPSIGVAEAERAGPGEPTPVAAAAPSVDIAPVDPDQPPTGCAGADCLVAEFVASRPNGRSDDEDGTLPELGEVIPVMASYLELSLLPGHGDRDVSEEPASGSTGFASRGPLDSDPTGDGDGDGTPGKDGPGNSGGPVGGNGGGEEFVFLHGTGGPSHPTSFGGGGPGGPGGGDGGGSGGHGFNGFGGFTGGGGGGFGGGPSGRRSVPPPQNGGGETPSRFAAGIGPAPVEVPSPAPVSLLGLGLLVLMCRRG